MLWLLLISLIFLSFISYNISRKDVLSPTFVLSMLFAFCTIFAIVGNQKWGVNFSGEAFLAIFMGLAMILLGEICSFSFYNPITGSHNSKYKDIDRKPILVDRKKLLFIIFIDVIILILYYRRLYSIASAIGYSNSNFLQFIRVQTINNGVKIGTFFSIFLGIIGVSSMVSLYILIYNHFYSRKKAKKVDIILLFTPTILNILTKALSAARNGFIQLTVYIVVVYVLLYPKQIKKLSLSKFFFIGIIGIFSFLIIFTELGKLTGKTGDNAIDKIILYVGSSIVALSKWLENYSMSTLLGQESFWGLRYLLSKFLPNVESTSQFLDSVMFDKNGGTNIFTGFRSYLSDFGWLGLIIICFLVGFILSIFYRETKRKKSSFRIIMYAYFFYPYLNLLFAPSITSDLFTSSQIFTVLWIIILHTLFLKRHNSKKVGNIENCT